MCKAAALLNDPTTPLTVTAAPVLEAASAADGDGHALARGPDYAVDGDGGSRLNDLATPLMEKARALDGLTTMLADTAGGVVGDVSGSPLLGTLTGLTPDLTPQLLGTAAGPLEPVAPVARIDHRPARGADGAPCSTRATSPFPPSRDPPLRTPLAARGLTDHSVPSVVPGSPLPTPAAALEGPARVGPVTDPGTSDLGAAEPFRGPTGSLVSGSSRWEGSSRPRPSACQVPRPRRAAMRRRRLLALGHARRDVGRGLRLVGRRPVRGGLFAILFALLGLAAQRFSLLLIPPTRWRPIALISLLERPG